MEYIPLIALLLLMPLIVFGAFVYAWGGFCLILSIADKFEKPELPMCDIEPRCHPGFVLDATGQAWIGNVKLTRW